jgi:hypothetical protein
MTLDLQAKLVPILSTLASEVDSLAGLERTGRLGNETGRSGSGSQTWRSTKYTQAIMQPRIQVGRFNELLARASVHAYVT